MSSILEGARAASSVMESDYSIVRTILLCIEEK